MSTTQFDPFTALPSPDERRASAERADRLVAAAWRAMAPETRRRMREGFDSLPEVTVRRLPSSPRRRVRRPCARPTRVYRTARPALRPRRAVVRDPRAGDGSDDSDGAESSRPFCRSAGAVA
jgi:hypothetical protein